MLELEDIGAEEDLSKIMLAFTIIRTETSMTQAHGVACRGDMQASA